MGAIKQKEYGVHQYLPQNNNKLKFKSLNRHLNFQI